MRVTVIAPVLALGAVTQATLEVILGVTVLDQAAEASPNQYQDVADRQEGGQYPATIVE